MNRVLTPGMRATRARILDSAAGVLSGRPLPSVTVQDLLVAAEVSRRTFYQYFRGLDAVTAAIYERLTDDLVDVVSAAVSTAEAGDEQIRAAVEAYLDFQADRGPLAIRLQAEAIGLDSPLGARREETLDRLVGLLEEALVGATGFELDPLLYRALLVGVEGLVIHLQRSGSLSSVDRAHLGRVCTPMVLQPLSGAQALPQRSAPAFAL